MGCATRLVLLDSFGDALPLFGGRLTVEQRGTAKYEDGIEVGRLRIVGWDGLKRREKHKQADKD